MASRKTSISSPFRSVSTSGSAAEFLHVKSSLTAAAEFHKKKVPPIMHGEKKTVLLSPYKHTEGLKESSTEKERFFSSSYFNSLFTSTAMHKRIHNTSELLKYLVRVSQKESP